MRRLQRGLHVAYAADCISRNETVIEIAGMYTPGTWCRGGASPPTKGR